MSLLDELEVYYACNQLAGNRIDEHTKGLDFIETGTVISAAGKLGRAVDGSGNTSNILDQPSNPAFLFGDEAMAISLWANVGSGEQFSNHPLLSVWDLTDSQRAFQTRFRSSVQRWQLLVSGDGTTSTTVASTAAPPFNGTFQHLVFQHDPDANVITLQVNDGAVISEAHSAGLNSSSTARPGLGIVDQLAVTPTVHLNHIDEVGLWRRNLTADEVTRLFNNNNGLPYSSFDSSLLSTHVSDRYSDAYLIELTNPQDPNATQVRNLVLNEAFTDISALIEILSGVVYDDENPQHIAISVSGIIALLIQRTGQVSGARHLEAWRISARALGMTAGRNRGSPASSTRLVTSSSRKLRRDSRPRFSDDQFDAFSPLPPGVKE